MSWRSLHYGVLLLGLVLTGCATVTPPEPQPEGLSVGESDTVQVRPGRETSRPVLALLDKARDAARQGDLDMAEAQLERALRIEPRNAILWHYMAKLRLNQGRLDQAAGLAAKSNSLDQQRNTTLQADNWRIIAHARYRHGDVDGARAAQQRADDLLKND